MGKVGRGLVGKGGSEERDWEGEEKEGREKAEGGERGKEEEKGKIKRTEGMGGRKGRSEETTVPARSRKH